MILVFLRLYITQGDTIISGSFYLRVVFATQTKSSHSNFMHSKLYGYKFTTTFRLQTNQTIKLQTCSADKQSQELKIKQDRKSVRESPSRYRSKHFRLIKYLRAIMLSVTEGERQRMTENYHDGGRLHTTKLTTKVQSTRMTHRSIECLTLHIIRVGAGLKDRRAFTRVKRY